MLEVYKYMLIFLGNATLAAYIYSLAIIFDSVVQE